MEKMEKIKKSINIALTVILAVAVTICVIAGVQIARGQTPTLFGYSFYYVLSGSMEPTIEANANVVVKQVDTDSLVIGDIITFESTDEAIYGSANTHRIVQITVDDAGQTCYITQGDANPVADEDAVYPDQIYGKVVGYTKAIYWVSLFFSFVQTGAGFVTVIIFPLMLVGYWYVKDFVKNVNQLIETQAKQELEVTLEAAPEVVPEVPPESVKEQEDESQSQGETTE